MPRKAIGDAPLTAAERQARRRHRKAETDDRLRAALRRIVEAKTVREARELAAAALST